MYLCNHCVYKAKWKSNIKINEISVQESAKYQCTQCDYKFTHKNNIKRHVMSVHKGVKYHCNKYTVKRFFPKKVVLKISEK